MDWSIDFDKIKSYDTRSTIESACNISLETYARGDSSLLGDPGVSAPDTRHNDDEEENGMSTGIVRVISRNRHVISWPDRVPAGRRVRALMWL